MIILVDHEDSFVHTLARYIAELGETPLVVRPDATSVEEIGSAAPHGIVLSPGPGSPLDCGLALDLVRRLGPAIPILGVCLGHQCIAAAHGAIVGRAAAPRHGMTSPIHHDGAGVFAGIPSPFASTRYHSLAVRRDAVPDDLIVTAVAGDDDEIMGVRHRVHPVEGVQFHPESVLSEHGHQLLRNFLTGAARSRSET